MTFFMNDLKGLREKITLHDKHFHSIKRNETPCEVAMVQK